MVDQPSEHLQPGTVLAGRYRIVRPLGAGGMGSVYLVEHIHTDQHLALKLLHSTVVQDEIALTRFRREARAPAKVGSDHVVQVTDADVAPELGGVPFLVMEWLRGHDLEEVAEERETLTPAEVVGYLKQAARALDKAHVLGIVHRDLKPENLFLTMREDGTPWIKILDFGIAKLTKADADPAGFKATGTGQIFGTPLYMAPEQIKAELERISPQTDIWALGIIAHRLLLGREPWTAQTVTHLVAQIAYEPMPVPSEHGSTFGSDFDKWFARCCARETGDRFTSAGEAVLALAKALHVELTEGPTSLPVISASSKHVGKRREAETAFSATAPARSAAAIPAAPLVLTSLSGAGSRLRSRRPLFLAGLAFGLAGIALGFAIVSRDVPPPSSGLATSTPIETTHTEPVKPTGIAATSSTAEPPIVTPSVSSNPVASASASAVPADRVTPHGAPGRPTPHGPTAPVVTSAPTAAPMVTATPAPPPPNDDPLGSRH